jgi:hypothetical protein
MPGSGEFKIGSSVGVVVRKGVRASSTTTRTVKGARDDIAAATASQPVADQLFASKLGLLQKCIGIQWGGGRFVFAGGGGGSYSPVPLALSSFSRNGGPITACLATSGGSPSKDAPNIFINTVTKDSLGQGTTNIAGSTDSEARGGCLGYVGIHGKTSDGSDVFVMGGMRIQNAESDSAGSLIDTQIPIIFFSSDGKNWTQGSCPTLPRVDGIARVIDSIPPITLFSNTDGCVTALGYDPQTHIFYATVAYHSDNNGWSVAFCTSDDGQNFSGGFQTVAGPNVAPSTFPLPSWPSGTHVNDATISYNNNQIAGPVQINSTWKYAAVNAPGQTMDLGQSQTLGMEGGSLTGINSPGSSTFPLPSATTNGSGIVTVVIPNFGSKGPTTYVSSDSGSSFVPVLDEFSYSSDDAVGNVSFS